jgi:signal transduction histidine kinase
MRGIPRFVTASRGFLDTFDLRRSEVEGHALDDVLKAHGEDGLAAALGRCLVTSETIRIDVEHRAHGHRRLIGLVAHLPHASGFAGHVVLEAKGRGHAVHSFEQRLTSVSDTVAGEGRTMAFVHDLRSHRLRYVDGGLARHLGLTGGSLHIDEFRAKLHPEDLEDEPQYDATRDALSDDEFATQTVRVSDRQGEWRLINLRTRVLRRSRDGTVRLLVGTATDITDYAAAAVEAAGISVARAEANERARIGRELHDSTSQHLVAADLGVSRVLRTATLSADERLRLQSVQESVSSAQSEMRAFAYFLHPPELHELGLSRTLERFCAGFARRSELEISFKVDRAPADLSSDAEHAMFRVCQEALMNVYRHAYAQRVSVELKRANGQMVLEVRDDGIGVDGVDRFEHGGIGVAAMRSRMKSIGGELVLDYLGPGLLVVARAPLRSAGEAGPAGLSGREAMSVPRADAADIPGQILPLPPRVIRNAKAVG